MVEPGSEADLPSQQDASVLMDELLESLKLLDYQQSFLTTKGFPPVTRAQFVVAASNPAQQFSYFTGLVSWLLQVNGSKAAFNKYDDPMTVANNIIVELKKIGIEIDYPPNKLRQGFGEGPCMVLLRLAKKGLEAKRFKFRKPVFPPDDDVDGQEVEQDQQDDILDQVIQSEEQEAVFADIDATGGIIQKEYEQNLQDNAPIWPSVDPSEWFLEVERVAPRLKIPNDPTGGDLREWRAHLEQTKQYEFNIQKELPATEAQLRSIADSLSRNLERINAQEKKINSSMPEITGDYRSQANDFNAMKTKYKQTNDRVLELSNQLQSMNEQIEYISEEIEKKGRRVTDSTPLIQIKEGLKALKGESKDMELRTAVLSHALFQAKLKEKSNHDIFD